MEFTQKEKLAWGLYVLGSCFVIFGTNAISGFWPAIVAIGTSLITAAAGLGIAGLRPTTGGR